MKPSNRHLTIGLGEVGTAVLNIFGGHGHDPIEGLVIAPQQFDIIHICFPYSPSFINDVKTYQEAFKPTYTIIHSTVPLGTSSACNATHSPIRGLHPNLEEGIRVFHKFIGGPQASQVADFFRRAGLRVVLFDKSETTEAMKLFDTEYYRACIEFAHRVKNYCDEHSLNFHEVYTLANQTYNEGYGELGFPEYIRPVLQPIMTEIGGHCLIPNSKLL